MVLLRLIVLSAVLLTIAGAYTVETRDLDVYTSTILPPGSGGRHTYAPSMSKVGGPDDFDTLPYRYGFRVLADWDVISGFSQFYRLCPVTPEGGSDDFVLGVQLTYANVGGVCDPSCFAGPAVASELSLAVFTSAGQVGVSNFTTDSGCDRVLFNLKQIRALTPDGNVWIRVSQVGDGALGSGTIGLTFYKDGLLSWSGQTCTYPAAASDVFSPCVGSFYNIFDCDNGVYEPLKEDCDLAIATRGCTAECQCEVPFKPDLAGGCTSCGNGLLELPFSEVCDTGLDPHCDTSCTKCENGWVLNPDGVCSLCGNGVHEVSEVCDAALSPLCSPLTCTCTTGCVGDGNGGCTLCGNGDVDPGEYCDAADPNCNADCTACARGRVARPRDNSESGLCTQCGNGVVDAGEVCDSTDYNCNDSCSGCERFHAPNTAGVCTRCGNGLLDKGEVCDSFRPSCKSDCSGCVGQSVASGDSLGQCSTCGNGILDDDEVCDVALDPLSCSSDCTSCFHPYVSVNRRCVTCGNGVRDRTLVGGKDEVCDAAQPGCRADCSACEAGYVPAMDSTGSCIAMCENCCASLPQDVVSTSGASTLFAFSALFTLCALLF